MLLPESSRKNVSPEKNQQYADTLCKMINCKTVWTADGTNREQYQRFYQVVAESFPLLHSTARRLTFADGCFFYVIEGANSRKNILLMSHHDVVDGDDKWDTDPFQAVQKDGALWGRGTIDTKTPLFAQLQAAEELLSAGHDFQGMTLYIGSSHNEEVSGDGMLLAVDWFRQNGIRFDAILDEGGAITTGMIPGVSAKSAMIAVHEKSRHRYLCTARQDDSGHVGLNPVDDSAVAKMASFIAAVEKANVYKGHFHPEVKATFTSHAPYMSFPLNLLFGNFTVFGPLIQKIMLKIPQTKAMLSTSATFTSIFGGKPDHPQFRAQTVEATLFLRCIREDDLYAGLETIKAIGKRYGVTLEEVERDYCVPTDFREKPYQVLESTLNENFPDVIVAPFLLTAGTDARRFSDIADSILRFAPIDLSKAQYATIHNANENITIQNIGQCVLFYKDFIRNIQGAAL